MKDKEHVSLKTVLATYILCVLSLIIASFYAGFHYTYNMIAISNTFVGNSLLFLTNITHVLLGAILVFVCCFIFVISIITTLEYFGID